MDGIARGELIVIGKHRLVREAGNVNVHVLKLKDP